MKIQKNKWTNKFLIWKMKMKNNKKKIMIWYKITKKFYKSLKTKKNNIKIILKIKII